MTLAAFPVLRRARAAVLTLAACGALAACAQPGAEGPRPAWITDLDNRFAHAMAADAPAQAQTQPRPAPQARRAVLSFAVESDVDAATFSARLAGVAERCWVADDAAYSAALESPTVVTLTYAAPSKENVAPVEALRIVSRARPEGALGLDVDAVGPLAAESHRRVIERGLRQAGADLSACL